MKKKFWG